MSLLSRLDVALLLAINGLAGRQASLDALMLLLTFAGMGGAIFLALAAALALRPAWRLTALQMVGAMTIAGVGGEVLKALVQRPRPPLVLPPGSLHLLVSLPASSSFPSGHAMVAFAAAAALWPRRGALASAATVLAAGIALSRVYLGVHFPSDVLAGATLGVAVAALVRRWPTR